jgi:hypothetical protein
MIYLTLGAIVASFSLITIRDRDISSSCFTSIKALSVVSPAFRLILAKAVDRFSAVFSVSAKSLT